jgi:hypothetical protein
MAVPAGAGGEGLAGEPFTTPANAAPAMVERAMEDFISGVKLVVTLIAVREERTERKTEKTDWCGGCGERGRDDGAGTDHALCMKACCNPPAPSSLLGLGTA